MCYCPETHLVFRRADIPDHTIMMLPIVVERPIQRTGIHTYNLPRCLGFNQECQWCTTRLTGRLHSNLPLAQVPVLNTIHRGRFRQPTSLSLSVSHANRTQDL